MIVSLPGYTTVTIAQMLASTAKPATSHDPRNPAGAAADVADVDDAVTVTVVEVEPLVVELTPDPVPLVIAIVPEPVADADADLALSTLRHDERRAESEENTEASKLLM
jgi:hypothetical protein